MADDDSSNIDVNDILGGLGDTDSESEGAGAQAPAKPLPTSAGKDEDDDDEDEEDEDEEDEDEGEGNDDESGDSDASALLAAISSSARASVAKAPVVSSSDSEDDKPAAKAAPKAAVAAATASVPKAPVISSSDSEDDKPAPKAAPKPQLAAAKAPSISSSEEDGPPTGKPAPKTASSATLAAPKASPVPRASLAEDSTRRASLVSDLLGDDSEVGDEEDDEDEDSEEDEEESPQAAGSRCGSLANGAKDEDEKQSEDSEDEKQHQRQEGPRGQQQDSPAKEENRESDAGLSSPGTRDFADTSTAQEGVASQREHDEETLGATGGHSILSGTSGTSSPPIDRTPATGTPARRQHPGNREAPVAAVAQPKPPERSRAAAIQNWASLAAAVDVPSLDEEGQLSVQVVSHPAEFGLHLDAPVKRGVWSSLQDKPKVVDPKGDPHQGHICEVASLVATLPSNEAGNGTEENGVQHQQAPTPLPAPVTPPAQALVVRPYASSEAGESRSSSEHDFLPDEDSPPSSPSQDSRTAANLQAAAVPSERAPPGRQTLPAGHANPQRLQGLRGWGSTPGGRLAAARNSARELSSPARQPSPRLQPPDTSRPWPVPAARKQHAVEELRPLRASGPGDTEGLLFQAADGPESAVGSAVTSQAAPLDEHQLPGEQHSRSPETATAPGSRDAGAGPQEPITQSAAEAHSFPPAPPPAATSSAARRPEPWMRRSIAGGSAAERRSQSVHSGLEPCADGAGPAPRLEAEAPTAPPVLNSMAKQPFPTSPPAERAVPRTQLSQPPRNAGRLGPLRGRAKTIGPGTAGSLRVRAKAASVDPARTAARTIKQDAAAAPKRLPLARSSSTVPTITTTTTTPPPGIAIPAVVPAQAPPPPPTSVPPAPAQAQAPARPHPQMQKQVPASCAAMRQQQSQQECGGYPAPDQTQPGSIAAAREQVLRMKEQVVALSAHCDALESMAVCSTNLASGGTTLAPAHAAAMRTASEQLAAWRSKEPKGPKLNDDPCAEAVARMREWIAEMAAEARCKETLRTLGDAPPASTFLPAASVSLEGSQVPGWQAVTQPGSGVTAGNRPPLRTSGLRRLQQIPVPVEASHARRVTTADEGAGPVGMVFLGSNGALRHTPSSGTPTPRTGSGVAPVPHAQWWAEALTHICTDSGGTKSWSTPPAAPSAVPCRAPSPRLTVPTSGAW